LVYSPETPANESVGHDIYYPNASTTATYVDGWVWNIVYGDENSSGGDVWLDKVCIGGACFNNQSVETATAVSHGFTTQSGSDGLLRLGFSVANAIFPVHQPTWFENMQYLLLEPLFTVDLKHKKPGSYNFGCIDPLQYHGEISYTSAYTGDGKWTFNIVGYGIGDNATVSETWKSYADTGTSVSFSPTAVILALILTLLKSSCISRMMHATPTTAQLKAHTTMQVALATSSPVVANFQTSNS
jgi:hypothetical protein